MSGWAKRTRYPTKSLGDLESSGLVSLGRGKVISKNDLAATPGEYPVYSSAKENDGKFGEYGLFMFDEELITWSVDGGGRLFHRPKHRFSVTNVGGTLRVNDASRIDCRFLFFMLTYLHSIVTFDWIQKAHPSVIRKVYDTVPLPPFEDQQQIVALLDEAFAAIATATVNAEKNLANARELYNSLLGQIFKDEKEWPLVQISKFVHVYDGPHATPKTVNEGPIFLGISALEDGEIKLGKTRHVTQADFETWTRRVKPQPNDVVFSYETRLGQAAIIPEDLECCLGRRMGLLRVKDRGEVDPSFLLRSYLSPSFQRFLRENTVEGATVDRFSIKDFPKFSMRIPPLEMQQRIVRACQQAKRASDDLAGLAQLKLSFLTKLRQSILQQAFSGDLTKRQPLAA